ncbi:DUF2332 domain-containing protein [Streptomyces sp. NPDC088847]|uniref:DUF2332 domain-containing protein n=1 Tax=Streptomyces sp. NPDC088847 TaxID=3365909 RepID=UPI00382D7B2D
MIPAGKNNGLRNMVAAMNSHMPTSASVLGRLVDDIEESGPVGRLVADHPDAAEPLFGVRVLAGVRLLTLSGKAPELADHLSGLASKVGDAAFNERAWELSKQVIAQHPAEVRAALDRPVQQHHPSRAGALLRGISMLGDVRVRLLEIGACAGLNLIADKYLWFGINWNWGEPRSPVRLSASGPRPADFAIVERAGCDLQPRFGGNAEDVMILRSFIPPEREIDQIDLDDALALVAEANIHIDQDDAVSWLTQKLSPAHGKPDAVTVVWHSFMWWYLSAADQQAIEEVLSSAARHTQVVRVAFEPPYAWSGNPRLQVHVY